MCCCYCLHWKLVTTSIITPSAHISSRVWGFLVPKKPVALWSPHIRVFTAHMPYKGITLHPGTDVTKNLKSIYGDDDALVAVWIMVKEFPAPRRPNMVPPFVGMWFITFHCPERMMTQNGSVTSILGQDMFSPIKNDQQAYTRPSCVTLGLFTSRSRWRKHVVTSS